LLNALFVAAEFSLVKVRRTRVRELAEQGVKGAMRVEKALASLDRFIAATQLGITFTSIGLGWLGEPALARIVASFFEWSSLGISAVASHSIAFGVAYLSIAFVHVVIGELAPKTMALQFPDRVALWIIRPLYIFEVVFRPFIWILNGAGNLVVRLLGLKPSRSLAGQVHSVTELHLLMEASEKAGVLERQEKEMMHGVLAIGDMTVRQVMVVREDIVFVRITDTPEQIVQVALESGYSRLPVVGTGLDDIQGILHTKDLLSLFADVERGLIVIQDLLRQPYFVRADKRLLDVLRVFQRGELHLALVQDEFGEMMGLVTLEDLLEEIVGDIRDEYDTSESPMKIQRDGSFLVSGHASVRECLSDLGVPPPMAVAGSVSDFLREINGGYISEGNSVSFQDLIFTVVESDGVGGARRARIVKGAGPR